MHVYDEDMAAFGDMIEWLPEEEAELSGRQINEVDDSNARRYYD